MKRLIIAAVGLALLVGIILGGVLGNPFDGTASAAPPGGKPGASPFEGVWEGVNRYGGQDWLLIEHEAGGVFSIKYYNPGTFGGCDAFPRLGLGGGWFESEYNRLRWYSWFWCLTDPPQRDASVLCDGFVYDEASDSLTCGDWGTWHRSKVRWHRIVP